MTDDPDYLTVGPDNNFWITEGTSNLVSRYAGTESLRLSDNANFRQVSVASMTSTMMAVTCGLSNPTETTIRN